MQGVPAARYAARNPNRTAVPPFLSLRRERRRHEGRHGIREATLSDSPDLASEILENLELNRKTHGLASASVTASTLIGAALRFIV